MSGIIQGLLASISAILGYNLYSFGKNNYGQLGLDDITNRSSPVQIGSDKWIFLSAGQSSNHAIKDNNTLWGWGRNNTSVIGDNSAVDRSSPVQIGALTDWAAVSTGTNHAFALRQDNTLWGWGQGSSGQLGRGSNLTNVSSPVQVGSGIGGGNWTTNISAGTYFTLAIQSNNTIFSWGVNSSGQLGQNDVVNRSTPSQIGSLTNWAIVDVTPDSGAHVLAIKTDNTLWAWGLNGSGRLGDGTVVNKSSPVQIGAGTDWAYVAAGGGNGFSVAIKTNGTLWSWGTNGNGNLGSGTTISRSSPVQVGALTNWSKVSSARGSLAIKTDKTLWAWGANGSGQLGLGSVVEVSSPVQVGALSSWESASAGQYHSISLSS